jgi:predicted nuclease of predicted toxin-antitoxin system
MNLFIDEDSVQTLLVRLLGQAGHDLITSLDVGLGGHADAMRLIRAIRENRVLLSHNHDDFEDLHLLIKEAKGSHPGIFIIRKDNDPARDMSPRGIVHAIDKFSKSGAPLVNEFVILNHWR